MTVVIEKNVPLQKTNSDGSATRKYPFPSMEVGDSFLINGFDPKSVAYAAYAYGKTHSQKFAVRKTPEGHRCWRVR